MLFDRGLHISATVDREPLIHRRQRRDIGGHNGGGRPQRALGVPGNDADLPPIGPDFQPGREAIHDVVLARGLELFEGVAEELGHIRTRRVHQRNLMLEVLRVTELDTILGDVLKAQVAAVNLIGLAFGNLDGHGHVAEVAANQRKPNVLCLDTGDGLIFKNGVQQQELPVRAGARRDNAVLAAGDTQVGGLIADVLQRGQSRAQLEVQVAQIAVLRDMETHAHGAGVAHTHLKVYVAHRAVEIQFAGVNDRSIRLSALGKVDHVFAVAKGPAAAWFLEAGGIRRQHEDRAVLAITKHACARRDVEGLGEAITTFGDQYDAAAPPAHGLLEAVGVVGNAIPFHLVNFIRDDDSGGFVGLLREKRLGAKPIPVKADHERKGRSGQPSQFSARPASFDGRAGRPLPAVIRNKLRHDV